MKLPHLWLLYWAEILLFAIIFYGDALFGAAMKNICSAKYLFPMFTKSIRWINCSWFAWIMNFVYKFDEFSHCVLLEETDRKDESLRNHSACPFGKLFALTINL